MAYTLTFTDCYAFVNQNQVTSPYTLKDGDVITINSGPETKVNNVVYSSSTTLNLADQNIIINGDPTSGSDSINITINFSESVKIVSTQMLSYFKDKLFQQKVWTFSSSHLTFNIGDIETSGADLSLKFPFPLESGHNTGTLALKENTVCTHPEEMQTILSNRLQDGNDILAIDVHGYNKFDYGIIFGREQYSSTGYTPYIKLNSNDVYNYYLELNYDDNNNEYFRFRRYDNSTKKTNIINFPNDTSGTIATLNDIKTTYRHQVELGDEEYTFLLIFYSRKNTPCNSNLQLRYSTDADGDYKASVVPLNANINAGILTMDATTTTWTISGYAEDASLKVTTFKGTCKAI